jgi:hypothetical protein
MVETEHNHIDDHVFAKLRMLRMNPSELCTDEVFIRRARICWASCPQPRKHASLLVRKRDGGSGPADRRALNRPEFADFALSGRICAG